jgi:hypothetical protein
MKAFAHSRNFVFVTVPVDAVSVPALAVRFAILYS